MSTPARKLEIDIPDAEYDDAGNEVEEATDKLVVDINKEAHGAAPPDHATANFTAAEVMAEQARKTEEEEARKERER